MSVNAALYDSLKNLGILDQAILDDALVEANQRGEELDTILLNRDLVADHNLGSLKSEIYHLPFVDLSVRLLDRELALVLPEAFARQYYCLVIGRDEAKYQIATANPDHPLLTELLQTRFGGDFTLCYATRRDLQKAFRVYSRSASEVFTQLLSAQDDSSAIDLVETMIRLAYEQGASDIHLEPSTEGSLVRFRVDGIMQDIVTLPLALHSKLTTRIKVLANLQTDENQQAQDGKIRHQVAGERLDIRVSIVPVVTGENVVLRLLSEQSRQYSLFDLGLSGATAEALNDARHKPSGMILVTGPTGSGKTTTLYSVLKLLNSRGVTIMTIEDPVEYGIDGISQIQVNPATNLTFADGLRAIVRQDPNIILVGEIRDQETASIAVNAAMTGHLVLSTLHTNDASTAIPRLIDMGVEPFLLSSTLNVIIAQRLVRRVCLQCRVSRTYSRAELAKMMPTSVVTSLFGDVKEVRLYEGQGCPVCQQTGYLGRVGIFEALVLSDEMKAAIVAKQDAGRLRQLAESQGMITMFQDGIIKTKAGLTTLAEVLRVTKE